MSDAHLGRDVADVKYLLGECIEIAERENSADGYFALVYLWETQDIEAELSNGSFASPSDLEATIVAFANRYLAARHGFRCRQEVGRAWTEAFAAARSRSLTVLQHLLLAFNAHINVDLGAAVAETGLGEADFDRVNEILARGVDPIQERLNRLNPSLRLLDLAAGRLDEFFAVFSLRAARAHASRLARRLRMASVKDRKVALDEADELVADLARRILDPGLLGRGALFVSRLVEKPRGPRALLAELKRNPIETR